MESTEDPAAMVYRALQQGVEDVAILSIFDHTTAFRSRSLSGSVEEWREGVLKLNLLQLAILYERCNLVIFLAASFPTFLTEECLYIVAPLRLVSRKHKKNALFALTNSPLHLACWLGLEHVVQILLDEGMDATTSEGQVTLTMDSSKSTVPKKRGLVEEFVELCKPQEGTPLQLAISRKHTRCAEMILNHLLLKMRQEGQRSRGRVYQAFVRDECSDLLKAPLLHKACMFGWAKVIELILNSYPSEALVLYRKYLPHHTAIRCGNATALHRLLEFSYPKKVGFSLQELERCLWFMTKSRFFGHTFQLLQILLDYGRVALVSGAIGPCAPLALLGAVGEMAKWLPMSFQVPKSRVLEWETMLNRKLMPRDSPDAVIADCYELILAHVTQVNAHAEMLQAGVTSLDSVLSLCRHLLSENISTARLNGVMEKLLKLGFNPNVWETRADLRHLQAVLVQPRRNGDVTQKAHLFKLLLQYGWDVGRLVPESREYPGQSYSPLVWLVSGCLHPLCTHTACHQGREDFVSSSCFDLLLNSMSVGSRLEAASALRKMAYANDDRATARAVDRVSRIVSYQATLLPSPLPSSSCGKLKTSNSKTRTIRRRRSGTASVSESQSSVVSVVLGRTQHTEHLVSQPPIKV